MCGAASHELRGATLRAGELANQLMVAEFSGTVIVVRQLNFIGYYAQNMNFGPKSGRRKYVVSRDL